MKNIWNLNAALGPVAQASNTQTHKAKARGLQDQDQPQQLSEPLTQNLK